MAGMESLLAEAPPNRCVKQTRPYRNFDIIVLVDDVVPLRDLLGRAGFGLKELWSENTWVVDSFGTEIPTAFILHDADGREVDAHAMRLDDRGNGIRRGHGRGLSSGRNGHNRYPVPDWVPVPSAASGTPAGLPTSISQGADAAQSRVASSKADALTNRWAGL